MHWPTPLPSGATLATALAVVLGASLMVNPAGVLAQSEPATQLTLPAESGMDADRERAVDDTLLPRLATMDAGAAGEAALVQLDRFSAPDWDIEELAASLGSDPGAAFTFVRDHIGFDPYPGVLRGAHGTLVARAGNAWDRTLLLQALLEAGGHSTELMHGELDDATTATVLERSLEGSLEPLADPPAAEVLGIDMGQLENRARRDFALVADGLGSSLSTLGAGGDTTHLADAVRDHAWVRLDDAEGSIDLDPTLPEAVPGETLSESGLVVGSVPVDRIQRLGINLVAEHLTEDGLTDEILLDQSLEATTAADAEIWLSFQATAGGIGAKLLDAMGDVPWVPTLSIDGETIEGTEFTIGSSSDAVSDFFGGGAVDPELTGLRIELVSEAPGREPLVGERILLDRVDPAMRAAGTVTAESLAPLAPAGEVLPAVSGVHQIIVSNGATDLRTFASARVVALGVGADFVDRPDMTDGLKMADQLYPLAVSNKMLPLASEHLFSGDLAPAGDARAFVGRPRGYLVSFEPLPDVLDGTSITTDLALDDIDVTTGGVDDPALAARVRLWHGVLQTALETEMARARSAAVDPATATLSSVSISMTDTPRLLGPEAAGDGAASSSALSDVLASGDLALLVEGGPTLSFWAVDPASGRTRSIQEPGVRIGHVGGGNYVNSSTGGPRYVVDPKTGRSLGTIRNGKFTPAGRAQPSRCGGGTEYVVVLGCVSIPASMTAGLATGVVITAIVAWATVILEVWLL